MAPSTKSWSCHWQRISFMCHTLPSCHVCWFNLLKFFYTIFLLTECRRTVSNWRRVGHSWCVFCISSNILIAMIITIAKTKAVFMKKYHWLSHVCIYLYIMSIQLSVVITLSSVVLECRGSAFHILIDVMETTTAGITVTKDQKCVVSS